MPSVSNRTLVKGRPHEGVRPSPPRDHSPRSKRRGPLFGLASRSSGLYPCNPPRGRHERGEGKRWRRSLPLEFAVLRFMGAMATAPESGEDHPKRQVSTELGSIASFDRAEARRAPPRRAGTAFGDGGRAAPDQDPVREGDAQSTSAAALRSSVSERSGPRATATIRDAGKRKNRANRTGRPPAPG